MANLEFELLMGKIKKELKSEQRAERKEKERALHGQYPKRVEEAVTCLWR